MSRKLAAILWAAKVLFIICFIISLPIVFWYTTDAKEAMTYTYKGILAGGTWDFITRNAASFFFYGFVFTLMLLIYRHNRKRVSQDRATARISDDDEGLFEEPNFNLDPANYKVSGNSYYNQNRDMHIK